MSYNLNNIPVAPSEDKDSFIKNIITRKKILIAVNADKIVLADEILKNYEERNSILGYCDGEGAIIAFNKKYNKSCIRVPGCELWLDIIRNTYLTKTFYFIGSKQETIKKVIDRVRVDFPGIRIKGFRDGYITDQEEENELINDICLKKPDIVFVAMGSPKQEILMNKIFKKYPALYMGLGGSFDIFSGDKKRVNNFFIKYKLEWLGRRIENPDIKRIMIIFKFFIMYLKRQF